MSETGTMGPGSPDRRPQRAGTDPARTAPAFGTGSGGATAGDHGSAGDARHQAGAAAEDARREVGQAAGDVRREVGQAAGDVRREAGQAAGDVRREAAGALEDVKGAAGEVLDTARDRAAGLVEEQREAGAERGRAFAGAIHRAADELEQVSPSIARGVHDAAAVMDDMSRGLAEGSLRDTLHRVEAFARQQPALFFGGAVLAGFALARFARSSAEHDDAGVDRSWPRTPAAQGAAAGRTGAIPAGRAPGWVPDDAGRPGTAETARPATTAAATLGGAAALRGRDPNPTGPR